MGNYWVLQMEVFSMKNKPENKLAFSVLATLTTGIALVYTFIMFHRIVFAVVGVGVLFLITAYILTQNIIAYVTMRNKSMNVQIKNYIDDISHQIETMNGVQSKLGKATYLYTRQAAEKVTNLENNYTESQAALYKNLSTITNTQNKATKLMIKYDLNNTTKLISTIKDMRNHLSETMVQGFDQIQPNNDDVVAVLNDIVSYLKSQPQQVNQGLSVQLNNVAHELQNISTSIQQVQMPAGSMQTQASVGAMNYSAPSDTTADIVNPETVNNTATAYDQEPVPEETNVITEAAAIPEPIITEEAAPVQETASTDMTETATDPIPSVDTIDKTATPDISATDIPATENTSEASANTITDDTVPEPIESAVAENSANDISTSDNMLGVEGKSSNDMLSADEIAALFAAADPTPKKEDPVIEDEKEEPFTPTFTVVGKSTDPVEEPEEPAKVATIGDVIASDDPNRQLSADEIAALFAAADPVPKKEEPVAAEEAPATPVTDDPNRQLSPDEIAALFAASEPTPKSDEEARIEEQKMDEALAAQAATAPTVTPVSDDPNKQLSPDEIAALFASLG